VSSETSIRSPLSVAWSKRTELIVAPVWRAQIGIKYDVDSLFGALNYK